MALGPLRALAQARELGREGSQRKLGTTLQRRVFFVHGGVARRGGGVARRGARVAERARAEGPRGGGGTTTPARDPPPENVRRRAGLGERREIGVDARLAGLGDRRETDVGVDARRRRAAASAAPVAWRAIGDGDRVARARRPAAARRRSRLRRARRRLPHLGDGFAHGRLHLPEVAAVEPRPRRPRRGPPLRRPELRVPEERELLGGAAEELMSAIRASRTLSILRKHDSQSLPSATSRDKVTLFGLCGGSGRAVFGDG